MIYDCLNNKCSHVLITEIAIVDRQPASISCPLTVMILSTIKVWNSRLIVFLKTISTIFLIYLVNASGSTFYLKITLQYYYDYNKLDEELYNENKKWNCYPDSHLLHIYTLCLLVSHARKKPHQLLHLIMFPKCGYIRKPVN